MKAGQKLICPAFWILELVSSEDGPAQSFQNINLHQFKYYLTNQRINELTHTESKALCDGCQLMAENDTSWFQEDTPW
jgi:hypothetical protein